MAAADEQILKLLQGVRGFLPDDEGEALRRAALEVAAMGPCLEVGSYCGRSTIWLAHACRERDSLLYAVDHHRGSEEHQPGEEYHDPELYDPSQQVMDSFREFRRNLRRAGLENWVVPLVAPSRVACRGWMTPLAMVFIDGGHSLQAAMSDYRAWAPRVLEGGLLAIHDIFDDPAQGGQAPRAIYRLALDSGLFEEWRRCGTLGVLRRVAP